MHLSTYFNGKLGVKTHGLKINIHGSNIFYRFQLYRKNQLCFKMTSLFYEGFTIKYTVTCINIQFIFVMALHSIYKLFHFYTHTHLHTPCKQSTNSLTFIHTLIYIRHVNNLQTLSLSYTHSSTYTM